MIVETLTVGPFESNCYVVYREGENLALVIDPGDDADVILGFLRQHNLTVAAYPLTHGHIDHVSALAAVYAQYPAPVGLHAVDAKWAFTERNAMPPFYEQPKAPPEIARVLQEGQMWTDAGLSYEVIETPGHTPGGVSFYFKDEGSIFVGDTLFHGSVGRTDFPGGSAKILTASLERLIQLPDGTIVYPGHGPETTIAIEKATNPFLKNR